MNLLIDTHILIRLLDGDNTLPLKIVLAANYKENTLYVSVASLWEMAIKLSLGKLSINGTFDNIFAVLKKNHISILPILPPHLSSLLNLPQIHKDPFDRIIIAQSIVQRFTLVSDDDYIKSYPNLKLFA